MHDPEIGEAPDEIEKRDSVDRVSQSTADDAVVIEEEQQEIHTDAKQFNNRNSLSDPALITPDEGESMEAFQERVEAIQNNRFQITGLEDTSQLSAEDSLTTAEAKAIGGTNAQMMFDAVEEMPDGPRKDAAKEAVKRAYRGLQESGPAAEQETEPYKVEHQEGKTLIQTGVRKENLAEVFRRLPPDYQRKVIEIFQEGSRVGQESIHQTADDVLKKAAEGYVDAIKAPFDLLMLGGSGLVSILEFQRDLIFNPQEANKKAAKAGESIGYALVAGIKLFTGIAQYGAEVQQGGDYTKPFKDLGNALNKWYDGLTPGDQMYIMASISAGFGIGAAAGQLRNLAKPGAFAEFIEETIKSVPKNPEAQAKAAESVKRIIEAFSRSKVGKLVTPEGVVVDHADDMLRFEKRIYKSAETGQELSAVKAAEKAGLDRQAFKQLSIKEKIEALAAKGWELIEPKKYHLDGVTEPLSEAQMADKLGKKVDQLRNMTNKELADLGITPIEQVNGRFPINCKYAGKHFPLPRRFVDRLLRDYPELQGKGLEHGIEFSKNGFPDFSKYSKHSARFQFTGYRDLDERIANKAFGFKETPKGYTWHHCPDKNTLELVPTPLHDMVKHTGGHAMTKELL